jgi:hypothetical protein
MKPLFLIAAFFFICQFSFAQNVPKDTITLSSVEDSAFTRVEVESEFPGGKLDGDNFWAKTLRTPTKLYGKTLRVL